jgi:5-amino-6-(5-phosphoribosylamino)uracil reductase
VAMSVDGYIDDASDRRLILSDAADLDRVDAIRADCDAILVGARTVRRDNPGLRVRSAARCEERRRRGRPESPVRVTLTATGELDPAARFFADDGIDRLVYAPAAVAGRVRDWLGGAATVIGCGDPLSPASMLADLAGRGIGRLMVEGGAAVLGQFLAAGLADELDLAIAPLFVADEAAPRLLTPPNLPIAADLSPPPTLPIARPEATGPDGWWGELQLVEVRQIGRMAVLRYRLNGPRASGGHDQFRF